MLPQTFRFIAVNNTGVDMRRGNGDFLAVSYQPWKFDANGAISYRTAVTGALNNFNGADILLSTAACDFGDTQDNSSNLDLGLHGIFSVTHTSGTANGSVDLYYEFSTDGGTTWAGNKPNLDVDADLNYLISVQFSSASGQRAIDFFI